MTSKSAFRAGGHSGLAVFHQRHAMSLLLQQPRQQALIDAVVFGRQDVQPVVPLFLPRLRLLRGRGECIPLSLQHAHHDVQQLQPPDWLDEVSRDAQLPAAGDVIRVQAGAQHQDGRAR